MDIQKEKHNYLAMLVAEDAITQDQCSKLSLYNGGNYFHSDFLASSKVDCINWGWSAWLKAKAQSVPEGKGRSDFEIIDQTIELVDLIASSNRFQRDKSKPFPFESNNPRNIEWWRLACKIQELLTDTDPDNCDFEEYKAMIEAQEPANDS